MFVLPPAASALLLGAILLQTPHPLRTGTQAVQVDVRVMDKDGRFVPTLTKDDFVIAEDGVAQEVLAVYLVSGGKVADVAAAGTGTLAQAASLPAGSTRQTWVFVFDSMHLGPGTLGRTRDAVLRFVRERFRDGDLAGVVANGRMLNSRLTTVREELITAIESIAMTGGGRNRQLELREWPRFRDELEAVQIANEDRETIATVVRRACEDDPSMCRQGLDPELAVRAKAGRMTDDIRAETGGSLATITALSSGLARIAGPKTVVLVSEGFVIERMEPELRTAVGHAARSGARFYTIDARGLNRGSTADIIDQPLADPGGAVRFDLNADGTTSLAVDTGGFAIRNQNDVGRALDLIARDADSYYVIGYRPANAAFDGKYRRIDVTVRTPGLKVRARRGYLALEPARMLAVAAAPPPVPEPAASGAAPTPPAPDARSPAAPTETEAPHLPAAAPPPPAPVAPPIAPASAGARKNAAEMVLALSEGTAGVKVAESLAADGWAAYQRGDLETAAAVLRQAVAGGESRPWVQYALGFAVLSQKRTGEAVAAWENVRAAAPEFQAVYYDLADAYTQLGDEKMALLVLRDAERRWPTEPDVFNAMGVIQTRRGAMDDAIESFGKAVKIAPQDSLGYFNLGRAYQMRYTATLRYVPAMGRHVGNERDRERAIASLENYVALGGPYVAQAREALASLAWK